MGFLGTRLDLRVGSNSDVGGRNREVRFTPDNGPPQTATVCPKSAHRFPCNKPPTKDHSATAKHGLKKILRLMFRHRRYSVFFEVRADLAWVARSMSGGGCCSPAIAHQTPT